MKKVAALVESDKTVPGLSIKQNVWKLFENKRGAKKAGAWSITPVKSCRNGAGTFRSWVSEGTVLVIEEF
ncbi:hypothetical protein UFOVP84_184 [uncultured Caudovirales phage]|uniref:Uncharacterized protein n=1 Tax=uncultured Caudovirales phage TaxID=2100421 RepID=A0A6J5L1D6_9CAUD|nr:hypothetical protein UFOVP84_184 [uncultured Caudovirales phage]